MGKEISGTCACNPKGTPFYPQIERCGDATTQLVCSCDSGVLFLTLHCLDVPPGLPISALTVLLHEKSLLAAPSPCSLCATKGFHSTGMSHLFGKLKFNVQVACYNVVLPCPQIKAAEEERKSEREIQLHSAQQPEPSVRSLALQMAF